ncbi:active breakpoint cluster region-related protein [Schistocerca nitens]|uniref:active breakpoint cluster region-related protein n=1 Tax=Schistocerca nitens TaxID=7011 RepID=UPI002118E449|nr:active breakpoint cluster region-related protein [Schistocerca nitens]
MSVFGDFRNVWAQRFPGSSLPAAWEEDVRTNLAKHKQKVAVLKEELEKEEFYVEYLERLLLDVEKHRSKASDNEESSSEKDDAQNESKRAASINETSTEAVVDGVGEVEKSIQHEDTVERNDSSVHQCVSELASPESKVSRSNSEVTERPSGCGKGHDNRRLRSITHPNISNYITVIEVNGLNAAKREGQKDAINKEQKDAANRDVPIPKKVPPKPPPKRISNVRGELYSVIAAEDLACTRLDENASDTLGSASNSDRAERKEKNVDTDQSDTAFSDRSASSSLERSASGEDGVKNKNDAYNLTSSRDSIMSDSGEGLKCLQQDDEEEPYYDSVAQDGDYVYLQTGDGVSTMTSGTSSGMTDTDTEGVMMTLPSNSPLSQSQLELLKATTPAPHSPDKQSNYVNIDYFIKHHSATENRSSSVESEDEIDAPILMRTISMDTEATDDVISNISYASSSSLESNKKASFQEANKAEAERMTMYRCIISSIIESETIYLECLNVMLQYMKAIKATLTTSQPVISEEEFNTIFYKVPDLHSLHSRFLEGLKRRTQNWDGRLTIGDHFRIMASNINIYGAFLHNYVRATETVKKCSSNNQQFGEITRDIRLKSLNGQSLSLEDLLHKPVARVQKNALVLHDLLRYTPESHPDHKTLTDALKMTQNFLDEFNMIQTKTMFPSADRAQRRLVKNSFIVELSDGQRKLRHLFLFNDVLACAKYKASGRDKFTFELKWYIPLGDIVIFEEPAVEPRENSPANIVALKSQACTVRDQILWDEKNDDKRLRLGSRSEKQRKKLADLEAQLVLASPNLVFRVGNRSSRTYTFFLSSEFERTQWIDAIHALQSCQLPSPNVSVSMYELQAWITACRNYLKTDMGSYLLRTGRDESLLVGDLYITLHELQGLDHPADLFVCVEVDSYGHYFRKAKTKLVCNSAAPRWNEEFIIELEGSQNLRILLYEESQDRAILRAKCTQVLSRSWLGDQQVAKSMPLQNCTLKISLKFVPSEVTLRRVPAAKTSGLFGAKIQQVCKRQKRTVPFIMTSCVREVERRGMNEVGIYRVSGSASDLNKLKKSFETNSYEAEQLLKEVDIHSVTGILKLYLRELPEALFTDELYPKFLEAFNTGTNDEAKQRALRQCFTLLPQQNQEIIHFLLAHLMKINQHESQNKMSLHNLATVFGPTLLRPGSAKSESSKQRDQLAASTVDVMAQAGILYYFLKDFSQS